MDTIKIKNRKIVKLGNSYAIVIPKVLVEDTEMLKKGQHVTVDIAPVVYTDSQNLILEGRGSAYA